MRAIEKENKRLKDILPKNFARPELDKRRLGDVVDLFTNIKMLDHSSEKDVLGRTYEYCLSMFAEQEGKRGGEFFTPSCVVRTLVEILQPFKGRVYEIKTIRLIQRNSIAREFFYTLTVVSHTGTGTLKVDTSTGNLSKYGTVSVPPAHHFGA